MKHLSERINQRNHEPTNVLHLITMTGEYEPANMPVDVRASFSYARNWKRQYRFYCFNTFETLKFFFCLNEVC